MNVAIHKARQDEPARRINHARSWPAQLLDFVVCPGRGNFSVAHRHRLRPRLEWVHRIHLAVNHDRVGRRLRRFLRARGHDKEKAEGDCKNSRGVAARHRHLGMKKIEPAVYLECRRRVDPKHPRLPPAGIPPAVRRRAFEIQAVAAFQPVMLRFVQPDFEFAAQHVQKLLAFVRIGFSAAAPRLHAKQVRLHRRASPRQQLHPHARRRFQHFSLARLPNATEYLSGNYSQSAAASQWMAAFARARARSVIPRRRPSLAPLAPATARASAAAAGIAALEAAILPPASKPRLAASERAQSRPDSSLARAAKTSRAAAAARPLPYTDGSGSASAPARASPASPRRARPRMKCPLAAPPR